MHWGAPGYVFRRTDIIINSFKFTVARVILSQGLIEGTLSDKCAIVSCVVGALFLVCCTGRRSSRKKGERRRA